MTRWRARCATLEQGTGSVYHFATSHHPWRALGLSLFAPGHPWREPGASLLASGRHGHAPVFLAVRQPAA
jgi:hypothetical protein